MQPWLGFTVGISDSLVVKEVIMINPLKTLDLGVNLKFVRLSGKVFFFAVFEKLILTFLC
jgi:hypothetical protein